MTYFVNSEILNSVYAEWYKELENLTNTFMLDISPTGVC